MPPSATIICRDSATEVGPQDAGAVLVCGSHFGRFPAEIVARHGLRAAVLHDAGVGLQQAGIAGLQLLQDCGIPAAAVDFRSARIGDGQDVLARGVVSHLNAAAAALGVRAGSSCRQAAQLLQRAAPGPVRAPPPLDESRHVLPLDATGGEPVCALDSASLIDQRDLGRIVVTGSHGGILGREPRSAAKVDVLAAVFNDAGGGPDDAGFARLPALDSRGIAAATVSAASARIGDGLSTWEHGTLSRVNPVAARLGARAGMSTPEFVRAVLRAHRTQGRPHA